MHQRRRVGEVEAKERAEVAAEKRVDGDRDDGGGGGEVKDEEDEEDEEDERDSTGMGTTRCFCRLLGR